MGCVPRRAGAWARRGLARLAKGSARSKALPLRLRLPAGTLTSRVTADHDCERAEAGDAHMVEDAFVEDAFGQPCATPSHAAPGCRRLRSATLEVRRSEPVRPAGEGTCARSTTQRRHLARVLRISPELGAKQRHATLRPQCGP